MEMELSSTLGGFSRGSRIFARLFQKEKMVVMPKEENGVYCFVARNRLVSFGSRISGRYISIRSLGLKV